MPRKVPDFKHCMSLMRSNSHLRQEEGFQLLMPHAALYVEDLMAEFRVETDHGLKCWLLELIGHARSEKAFELLKEQLAVGDLAFRDWAIRGLQRLNSAEARKLLKQRGFDGMSF